MEEFHMIYISVMGVFLLGIGATMKYGYKVVRGKIKDLGSFIAFGYLTAIYGLYLIPGLINDLAPFVRLGISMLFLVKVLTFIYDIALDVMSSRCSSSKSSTTGGK